MRSIAYTRLMSPVVPTTAALMAVLLVGTSCGRLDPYAEKFPKIELGDHRARVVDLMGQPDSVSSVEVLPLLSPLVKAEQLVWRAPVKGRTYAVLTVMDRAALKLVFD